MSATQKFVELIRDRSNEHRLAVERVCDLPAVMASLLRQELDSLVRVLYLLSLQDIQERERLINQTLAGTPWTVLTNNLKYRKITDREMVDVANLLHGWAQLAYKFACSFIHLSNFHNYSNQNPFDLISASEQSDVLKYMRQYHGGPSNENPSFKELSQYFPKVFDKINANLECYLENLESNSIEPVF